MRLDHRLVPCRDERSQEAGSPLVGLPLMAADAWSGENP